MRAFKYLLGLVALALLIGQALLRSAGGRRLPEAVFETPRVYALEFLGRTVYVDHALSVTDAITALGLVGVAVLLAVLARRARHSAIPAGVLYTAAAGAAFLAGDDLLALHETLGHNLVFLDVLPLIDHRDDAIVGLYGLIVAAWLWRHRAFAPAQAHRLWLTAIACGGLAVGLDLLPFTVGLFEEILEALCALFGLAGTVWAAQHARTPVATPEDASLLGVDR